MKTKDSDHEQKLAQARKAAGVDAERLQRRTEAEVADLKATISRLEVDLMKVILTRYQPPLDKDTDQVAT